MKKILIHTITLISVMLISFSSYSQSLGIDTAAPNLISLPDTINLNDNYNHSITVQNKSAIPFSGTIWLMAAVDTGTGIIGIDSVGFATVTNFGLNDTLSINYNETYGFANDYKLGGNIVVVWPIAANCPSCSTSDSLYQDVFILNPSTINEIKKNAGKIYPNPTTGILNLQFENSITPLEINIYDLSGRRVFYSPYSPFIDISRLNKGVYVVRLLFKEEEIHFKLIKE